MSQTLYLKDDGDPQKQKRRVFFATPCYTGNPSGIYVYAMLKTIAMLDRIPELGWEWCLLMHNCHVDDSRNTLVRNFRGSECTDLMFLDADNGWHPNDVARLLYMEEEFVGGVYPKKSFDDDWPVQVAAGEIWSSKSSEWAPQGLVKALRIPTGFMRLRRSVIDKMVQNFGQRQYRGGDQRADLPPTVLLFERTFGEADGIDGKQTTRRWGGDWDFCNKWRQIGGEIWIDPTLDLQHTGPWNWTGSVGEFWKKKSGVSRLEMNEKIGNLIEVIEADPVAASKDIALLLDLCEAWNNPWALPPDQLAVLMSIALESHGPTLECGSGLSTLILAVVAKHKGTRHYALEHSKWHSAATFVALRRHGLSKHVEIVPAELERDEVSEWYGIPADLPRDFGFLLVDGPPQEIDVSLRWRAVEKLGDRLAPGATVMADDVDQKGFGTQLEEWGQLLGCKFHIFDGKPRRFAVGKLPAKAELSEAV